MIYAFDNYELDTQTQELRQAGNSIRLAPKVYHVLVYLIEHHDRLVSKEELLEQLWPGVYVDDSAVKRCIMAARRAIGDRVGASQRIRTQRSQGYRFVAAVTSDPLPGVTALPAPAANARHCPACHHANSLQARFCVACGATLCTTCAHCAQDVELPAGFCPACGQPLEQSVTPATVSPTLRGERKLVTLLSCALANPPLLHGDVALDDRHRLVQAVCTLARPEVERYAGLIQHVTAEGFLAVFGAPVAQEDHAQRAVLAALGLQRHLRDLRPPIQLPSGEALVLRMALHTELVVIGQLAEGEHPTIVGEATGLVTALSRQAAPGTLLASAATLRLVQEEAHTEKPRILRLKERATPIEVARILTFAASRVPPAITDTGLHKPFVGRETEMAILHNLLHQVERGQGQVVGIVGEPGIGKSRLLYELWQHTQARNVTYLHGRCQPYGSTIPYLPIRDLLYAAWGIAQTDSVAVLTAKVREQLHGMDMDPDVWMPYLLLLFGLQVEPEQLAGLSPEIIRTRTFEVLHQMGLNSSRTRPLILTVEDLHWIDASSEAYLTALVERLAGVPILLLVTFRPGYRPAWLDKSYVTQLALQPLGPQASLQVVRAVLRQTPVDAHLEQQLLAKAEGNPFFLEELAQTLVERESREAALAVPDTVQGVLAARIDLLPSPEKRLLQTAAVIGKDVPLELLQAIAGLPEAALRRSLSALQALEFIYETRFSLEHTYTFKHVLTHEVAYRSLLQEQRQTLHARIVEVLETRYADRLSEQVDVLARHALEGGLWDQACSYFRQAGLKAMARSAH